MIGKQWKVVVVVSSTLSIALFRYVLPLVSCSACARTFLDSQRMSGNLGWCGLFYSLMLLCCMFTRFACPLIHRVALKQIILVVADVMFFMHLWCSLLSLCPLTAHFSCRVSAVCYLHYFGRVHWLCVYFSGFNQLCRWVTCHNVPARAQCCCGVWCFHKCTMETTVLIVWSFHPATLVVRELPVVSEWTFRGLTCGKTWKFALMFGGSEMLWRDVNAGCRQTVGSLSWEKCSLKGNCWCKCPRFWFCALYACRFSCFWNR